MKNKKWFTYTLGILLTLIVLAVVGGVAFRIGAAQSSEFVHPMINNAGPAFSHGFDMPGGNFHDQEFGGMGSHGHGFDRGGRSFFSPIFGLIRLAVLGLLLWGGYKLIQKSGWRLTRVTEPAAVTSETPSMEVEEKKEAE